MGQRVLEIESLSFGYNQKLLYKDFSLSLNIGECIAIVGASGSGKSTLFELIAGNLKPKRGKIKKSKIGWIFQDPYSSFHPTYTVYEQIKEVTSVDMSRVDEYIKSLGITKDLLYCMPHQLSGGELQRCSILRAVMMRPKLLLCDEPTSALDNITQLETMKLLMTLLKSVGIVLITHDIDLAKWSADKIIDITQAR